MEPQGKDFGGFHGRGPREGMAAERMLRHAQALNLSDEQIGKLKTLVYETKKKLVDLHSEIEKGQLEIQNLLQSGNDDLTQIRRHLTAISKAHADTQEARIANLFEARKVLTAEQKKLVKENHPRLGMILE
jgi:Spy/CpxP family protein refolding chaperone